MPYDLTTKKDAKDRLAAGETLPNMDFLRSENGLFAAVMKNDNKLCVYLIKSKEAQTKKIQCSASENSDAGKGILKLAESGELTIVNSASNAKILTVAAAASGEGIFLIMQNDGNLVTYDKENKALWGMGTQQNDNYFKLDTALIANKVQAPFSK